jgi:hypothetical protein
MILSITINILTIILIIIAIVISSYDEHSVVLIKEINSGVEIDKRNPPHTVTVGQDFSILIALLNIAKPL